MLDAHLAFWLGLVPLAESRKDYAESQLKSSEYYECSQSQLDLTFICIVVDLCYLLCKGKVRNGAFRKYVLGFS